MVAHSLSLSHEERTADQPRAKQLHPVILNRIDQINESIKLLRLQIPRGENIRFLPGQWLDVHVPDVPKAGGFTITSTPDDAQSKSASTKGFLELAVQRSPRNPPAAWLWRSPSEILGSVLNVRVGGSFIWPPPGIEIDQIKNLVFIAGGVGINPLVSIAAHLAQTQDMPERVSFLYSTRGILNERICFLSRLQNIFPSDDSKRRLALYLTGNHEVNAQIEESVCIHHRRITEEDILTALGDVSERSGVICYVCGPPGMTDKFVEVLGTAPGMDPRHVFCERWW
ncbi:ferredoxin reductase-like protein [Xylona heveae TC161]|uniref:Oxidoreductase NAD-binding domain-containing protein 1 n=1 Tax=Xylona heveae (strain CBS 132557 / TC161) TaxID=1328760 RepID=A0A165IL72_XYLHT|nr:ferredoxin reductase-like protein [Xylona heveae TC161]KZF25055.1 ferredoxin reductase-like protein [Xylona heveae TC161]